MSYTLWCAGCSEVGDNTDPIENTLFLTTHAACGYADYPQPGIDEWRAQWLRRNELQ